MPLVRQVGQGAKGLSVGAAEPDWKSWVAQV
jgi:hypothetical protein